MLYALIPNIPLINVNLRPIKPNKLVMLYDKKYGEIDHLKYLSICHMSVKPMLIILSFNTYFPLPNLSSFEPVSIATLINYVMYM